jgi:hypothetical protein
VILLFNIFLIFSELGNRPHEGMSFSVLRIASSALQHWLRDVYSASVELNAISIRSLLGQCIGTKCVNSWCHTPLKLLSQYASSESFFGFHDELFVSCALQVVDDTIYLFYV